MESFYQIKLANVLQKSRLKAGDKVTLVLRSEKGRMIGKVTVPVVQRYKHHVLLDFGKYKECRRIVDIEFGLANI